MWHPDSKPFGQWGGASAKFGSAIQAATQKAYSPLQREVDEWGRSGTAKKTVRRTPQYDANYFRFCDEQDPAMRYGIWNVQEDLVFNLMRPAMNNQAEVNITYVDFRNASATNALANTNWCTVPAFAAMAKLGRCNLRYCFNFNEHYTVNREALTPNDFAMKCYRDALYDIDGRLISNEDDYQNAMMFIHMRESILDQAINGDPAARPTTDMTKGIRRWFLDFTADHPELGASCDFIKPTVVSTAVLCADLGKQIEDRIRQINYNARDIRLQGTGQSQEVPIEAFYLLVSERAAECIVKCHVCQDVCGAPLQLQAMTPDQLREWKMLYPSYLNGGKYGHGYIVTPNGYTINLVRSRRLADNEAYLLTTGHANDSEAGIRIAMHDYTAYINYLVGSGKPNFIANNLGASFYGGSVLVLNDDSLCGDTYARWGFELMARKPQNETYFSNIDLTGCDAPAITTPGPIPPAAAIDTNNCP